MPFFSGWLVIALLLSSVSMFVALIDRIPLLQINRMLAFTGDHGRRAIKEMYPPLETPIVTVEREEFLSLPVTQTLFHTGRPQAVQAYDVSGVLSSSSMLALSSYSSNDTVPVPMS